MPNFGSIRPTRHGGEGQSTDDDQEAIESVPTDQLGGMPVEADSTPPRSQTDDQQQARSTQTTSATGPAPVPVPGERTTTQRSQSGESAPDVRQAGTNTGQAESGLTAAEVEEIRQRTPRASQSRSLGTTGTPGLAKPRGPGFESTEEIRARTRRASQSRSLGTTGTPTLAAGSRSKQVREARQAAEAEAREKLDEQIDDQFEQDFVEGEDYTISEDDGTFRAELTEAGQRKARGDEFEDEVTSFSALGPAGRVFDRAVGAAGFEELQEADEIEFSDIPGVEAGTSLEDITRGGQQKVGELASGFAEATNIVNPAVLGGRAVREFQELDVENAKVSDVEEFARGVVSEPEEETPAERQAEAATEGAVGLVGAPFSVATAGEEAREAAVEFERVAKTDGLDDAAGFAKEESAEFGADVASGFEKQLKSPTGRAQLAGSLAGSALLFGGTAAVSSRLGGATRAVIQPGEEILSAGATRAFPRVAQRFPGGKIDNEEIVIRAGSRLGRGTIDSARNVKNILAGEAELRPTPQQSRLVDRFRPGAGTDVFAGGDVDVERQQSALGGARSEPLGSPTEGVLDATTGIDTEVRVSDGETEVDLEGVDAEREPSRPDGLPLQSEIQEAGGVRPFIRGEEPRIGSPIRPSQVEGFKDLFEGEERAQATPANLLPQSRGSVETEQMREEFVEFEQVEGELSRRRIAQRQSLGGDFEGAPRPFVPEAESAVETEQSFDLDTVDAELERRAEAQSPFTTPRSQAKVDVDFGQEPFAGIESRQRRRTDTELDTETEAEVEPETQIRPRTEAEFEFEFESEFESEGETEVEMKGVDLGVSPRRSASRTGGGAFENLFKNPVADPESILSGEAFEEGDL